MLSPVRQGSGLFSNVLISGHGPGVHPQLPLTPLTPTPRVLLCRSSESFNPPVSPLSILDTTLTGMGGGLTVFNRLVHPSDFREVSVNVFQILCILHPQHLI